MKQPVRLISPLIFFCTLTLFGTASHGGISPPERLLSISGRGEIKVTADMAVVRMRVEKTHRSANATKIDVDNKINSLLKNLKKLGIKQKDVVASTLQLHPNFDYQDRKRIFSGYSGSRSIVITLTKLSDLNRLLDTAIESGINQIDQIALMSSKAAKNQSKARQLAIQDSKNKARLLAQSYQAELGPIHTISYQSNQPIELPKAKMGLMRMAANSQTSSGGQYLHDQITFTDSIQVVFELLISE